MHCYISHSLYTKKASPLGVPAISIVAAKTLHSIESMDDNFGEWVEYMGVVGGRG